MVVKKSEPPRGISAGAPGKLKIDHRSTAEIVLQESGPENLDMANWLAGTGRYISGEALAIVIEANPGQPLPDQLREYLCQFLRGKCPRRKPGPKQRDKVLNDVIDFLARRKYQDELLRLQKEERPRGRDAVAQGMRTPHEEATKIVKEYFPTRYGHITLRRVANILSSHK